MLTFAVPLALASLLALPVVVLLHRFRARRERRDAAGTFLWTRAQARGVARPRLRTTLLLALQLLATAALALAAARPYLATEPAPTRILVIDTFASMAARDGATSLAAEGDEATRALSGLASDATRLDVARRIARNLTSGGGDTALIQAGATPTLLVPPTRDTNEIQAALDALHAVDATRDGALALTLARDVASTVGRDRATEIHWLSDQPPPATTNVQVHDLAGTGSNVGITGFERVAGQAWIRVASNQPRPADVTVDLLRGDTRLASTSFVVPAGGAAARTLAVPGDAGLLHARIRHDGDVLPLDDDAWSGEPRTLVALDAPLPALERALGAIDGVDLRITPAARAIDADLHVLTRASTGGDAARFTLTLPRIDAPAIAATVTRTAASDPLLRFVDLDDLVVAYVTPSDAAHANPEPAHVLVTGATATGPVPLVTRIERDTGVHLHLAFHPARGDLTLQPAWPTLVVNLIDATRNGSRIPLGTRFDPPALQDGAPVPQARTPGPYLTEGRTVHASLLAPAATNLPRRSQAVGVATPSGQAEDATAIRERLERALPRGWTVPLPGRDLTPILLALAFAALWSEAWLRRALRAP